MDAPVHVADFSSLARAIRAERRRRGLKQAQLAAMAGIALGSLRRLESGNFPVTTDTLLRVTDALALDVQLAPRRRSRPLAPLE